MVVDGNRTRVQIKGCVPMQIGRKAPTKRKTMKKTKNKKKKKKAEKATSDQ